MCKILQKNKFVDFSMSTGMMIVLQNRAPCFSIMLNLSTMNTVKFGLEMDVENTWRERWGIQLFLYFVRWKKITSKKYQEESWVYENVPEKNVRVKKYFIELLITLMSGDWVKVPEIPGLDYCDLPWKMPQSWKNMKKSPQTHDLEKVLCFLPIWRILD